MGICVFVVFRVYGQVLSSAVAGGWWLLSGAVASRRVGRTGLRRVVTAVATVMPAELGDDAVAQLYGAAVGDAEFPCHLLGCVSFGHEFESPAFVGSEHGDQRVDTVGKRTVVAGVGHIVVEREPCVGALQETPAGESAATKPVNPQGFPCGRHIGAYLCLVSPYLYIAFLYQLGTTVAVV